MKCLNCGIENEHRLCVNCCTPEVLDPVFRALFNFYPDYCEYPYVIELLSGATEKNPGWSYIPELLDLFQPETREYYDCRLHFKQKTSDFEERAIKYLNTHSLSERKTQLILYDLLLTYMPGNYLAPLPWCEIIYNTDGLCCELYRKAAEYFAMVGDYDISDEIADKTLRLCEEETFDVFLFSNKEKFVEVLQKQKETTNKYRTVKPYWPNSIERRRAISEIYDEKNISHPRTDKPEKVAENDFIPISEAYECDAKNYCTFWCSEAFCLSSAKNIYEIAAVRIKNGKIDDTFQSLVRPWDSRVAKEDAARKLGVTLSTIDTAPDVDMAVREFFNFVGPDKLVSTDALGDQGKLLMRAARYSGMKEIANPFFDLYDFALEQLTDWTLADLNRDNLLSHFSIAEGSDALGKARANVQLMKALSR